MSIYPNPSAPPYYLDNQRYNGNARQPVVASQKDLNDDCSICYDQLKVRPVDDNNRDLVLAKTKCNHYFHEHCLDGWLKKSAHQDCPECRGLVYKNQVTLIPVSLQPVLPNPNNGVSRNQNNVLPPVQVQEGPGALARVAQGTAEIGKAALQGTAELGKAALWGIWNTITQDSPETIKRRQIEVEHRITEIHLKWSKMPVFFQVEKAEIDLALASIRSLMANNSKDALKAVKKLEYHVKNYEAMVQNAQKALLKDLNYFQQELATVVRL